MTHQEYANSMVNEKPIEKCPSKSINFNHNSIITIEYYHILLGTCVNRENGKMFDSCQGLDASPINGRGWICKL